MTFVDYIELIMSRCTTKMKTKMHGEGGGSCVKGVTLQSEFTCKKCYSGGAFRLPFGSGSGSSSFSGAGVYIGGCRMPIFKSYQ